MTCKNMIMLLCAIIGNVKYKITLAIPESSGICDNCGVTGRCSYSETGLMKSKIQSIAVYVLLTVVLSIETMGAGLAAHWNLNEIVGTTAFDSSNEGANGSYGGTYTLGVSSRDSKLYHTAVQFNGTDGDVWKASWSTLNDLTNDFTIAAWINPDVTSGTQNIFASDTGGKGWSFKLYNGTDLRLTTYGVRDYDQSASIATGVWTHVAVTVDSSNDAEFFINGVSAGTVTHTSAGNPADGTVWHIGNDGWSGYFDGGIDEVRIYDGALSADEVSALSVYTVAHWGLNETSGTTASDSSDNGADAEYDGNYTLDTASRDSDFFDTAVDFSGSGQAWKLGWPALNNLTANFTVAAWIKPDAVSGNQRVFSHNGGGKGWGFGLDQNQLLFTKFGVADYWSGAGAEKVVAGEWTHIAVTVDANDDIEFFINGRSIATVSAGAGNAADDTWYIASSGNGEYFDGVIDEVRVYHGVLPNSMISSLSRAAVIHWKFDETTGTTADDASVSEADGTYAGTYSQGVTAADDGICGTAVDFNGTDGEVSRPGWSELNALTNNFTVAAWIKPDVVSGTQRVFSNDGGDGWGFGLDQNQLLFTTYTVKDYWSGAGATVSAGEWTHIAVTMDANNDVEFFINGVSAAKETHTAAGKPATGSWYAAGTGSGSYFDGAIDELRVYKGVISDSTIASWASAPVLHWNLDESAGTAAADSGPNNLGGVYQGGFTLGHTSGDTVLYNTAVDFNGSNGEVYRAKTSLLWNLTNNFTVCAWINPDAVSGVQRIFSSAGGQWGFGMSGNNLQFTSYGKDDYTAADTSIDAGRWTHVGIGFGSDNQLKFYVNGKLMQIINAGQATSQNTTVNWFAAGTGTGQNFDGALDEVRVYEGELTEAMISRLARWESPRGTFFKFK
jgi:hypothetical protein